MITNYISLLRIAPLEVNKRLDYSENANQTSTHCKLVVVNCGSILLPWKTIGLP